MITDQAFQETVLKGVETVTGQVSVVRTNQEKLLADYSRLDSETKKSFDDLTAVKKNANDFSVALAAIHKVLANLQRESRMAFGDPMARILASEERRDFWNGFIRRVAYPGMQLPENLQRAMTGVDSSMGQATVPSEVASEVFDTLSQYGQFGTLGRMNVGARSNQFPLSTARPTYYWIGAGTGGTAESAAITEGSKTGTYVTLSIQTLAALMHVTEELIQDSTVDISGMVLADLAQSIAYGLDFMSFQAAAAASQAEAGYRGIFALGAANANLVATAAAGNTTVAGTTGLDVEDFVRCLTTVSSAVLSRPCKWWMHPYILAKCCLIKDNNGRPIFQSVNEAPSPGIGSILGYPIIPTQAAPSIDAAGAKVAVFGDPNGYVVGIRKDLELAQTNAIKFAENMRSFRALTRAGGIARQSTTTVKPFAVLTTAAA